MPARYAIPGLKRLPKSDGFSTWYWTASQISRLAAEFRPKTARLWYGRGEPSVEELSAIAQQARRLTIELKEWIISKRRTRPSVRGFIYFARVGERVKIGFSKSVPRRISELQTLTADPIDVLLIQRGSIVIEHSLHRRFAEDRISGEWFRYSAAMARFVAGERKDAMGSLRRSNEPTPLP
jgi:hypothetical protein